MIIFTDILRLLSTIAKLAAGVVSFMLWRPGAQAVQELERSGDRWHNKSVLSFEGESLEMEKKNKTRYYKALCS